MPVFFLDRFDCILKIFNYGHILQNILIISEIYVSIFLQIILLYRYKFTELCGI